MFFLVVAPNAKHVDSTRLRKAVGAHRSWQLATSPEVQRVLGVRPGAVSPLALHRKHSPSDMIEVSLDVA